MIRIVRRTVIRTVIRTVLLGVGLPAGLLLCALIGAAPACAEAPLRLDARFAQSVMTKAQTQRNYLRIGLAGCERRQSERMPVNVAFVLDRSGSMRGRRIIQARDAAIAAVRRLDRNDIASVVIFDDKIDVLVAAQPVTDPAVFIERIGTVATRGSTAIYGGVNEGAQQVRRHYDRSRLNRVVLLSDGEANVGPRKPEDFARLGRELMAQGITVSTIGLGDRYNEDLMLALARAADGNHSYVGDNTDLVQVFNREFDDVLNACAQTVAIDVELAPGARVVRALSRDGEIAGQTAQFRLAQVYAATEHYVLMEVEIDAAAAAGDGPAQLGRVRVTYSAEGADHSVETPIEASFSGSDTVIAAGRDNAVMEAVIEQNVRGRSAAAVALRDQGRHDEAQALFRQNVQEIDAQAANASPSERLRYLRSQFDGIAANRPASPTVAGEQRKLLRQLDINPAAPGARY